MSKTPISGKDVSKGDKIRIEYDPQMSWVLAEEYIALGPQRVAKDREYFLLDRPVVLPTKPGHYEGKADIILTLEASGGWYYGSNRWDSKDVTGYLPLTRLMTKTEWEAGK